MLSNESLDKERSWYITRNITYRMRWKINQMKLMLQDIETLTEKFGIAHGLQPLILRECEEYLQSLERAILDERIRRDQLKKKVLAT